jgi:ubiquinone/menaquinone biosynthesis C-methylase UbiE
MGFMFFPDMQLAANEMFRVCRVGGRMSISVWGEKENNDWYTTMLDVLSKHIDIPRSLSGGPGMFRCSKPGLMKTLFESAGFKNVKEETISGKLDFKTAENYWLNRTEISEQIVNLLSNLHESTRDKIKAELFEVCKGKMTNGNLIMDYASLVISAEK